MPFSGSVARKFSGKRADAGAMPAQAGAVNRKFSGKRANDGAMPSLAGTVLRIVQWKRSATGSLPRQTGDVTRKTSAKRDEFGSLPGQAGSVVRRVAAYRGIAGLFSLVGVPETVTEYNIVAARTSTLQTVFKSTWSEARDAATADQQDTGNSTPGVGTAGGYFCYRSFMAFDVSALSPNVVVSAAKVKIANVSTSVGPPTVVVVEASQSNPISLDDFDLLGATKFSDDKSLGTGVQEISLNSNGVSYIQAAIAGGAILLAIIEEPHDYDNTAPSGNVYSDWSEGASKLELTYTPKAGRIVRKFSGKRSGLGQLSFSGIVQGLKGVTHVIAAIAGALSLGGGVIARKMAYHRQEVGVLDMAGTPARKFTGKRVTAGIAGFTGNLTRKAAYLRSLVGSISFSGTIDGLKNLTRYFAAVAGALSWGGGVIARKMAYHRQETGSISAVGTASRKFTGKRALTGIAGFAGSLTRKAAYLRKLAGDISFSGIILGLKGVAHIVAAVAGVLSWGGGVIARKMAYHRQEAGALNMAGTPGRKFTGARTLAGVLAPAGSIGRRVAYFRRLAGGLSLSGIISRIRTVFITGSIRMLFSARKPEVSATPRKPKVDFTTPED